MPVVLVIIIVAAWAVILGPSLLKRRANSGGVQSITHFHHQLRVLEQRAPEPLVAPAYRLRSVDGTGSPTGIHYPDDGRPPVLTVVGAKELPRPALAFLGEPEVVEPVASRTVPDTPSPAAPSPADSYGDPRRSDDPHAGPVPIPTAYDHRRPAAYAPPVDPSPAPRAMESVTRAQARRRRRDTLAVLFGLFFVMLLVGLMTGATGAWAVAAPRRCGPGRLRGAPRAPAPDGPGARAASCGTSTPGRSGAGACPARRATSAAATPTRRASRPSPADRATPVTRAHRRTRR